VELEVEVVDRQYQNINEGVMICVYL